MADPFAARLDELKASAGIGSADPFAARLEELKAPAPAKAAEQPGFFSRAATSIGEGVGHVGAVAKAQGGRLWDLVTEPRKTIAHNWSPEGLAQHTAERKELLRGVDDVTMLGYGQRLAARVGNAAGDVERGTSLDETKHFSPDVSQGDTHVPSQVQAREQAMAPDVRPASQLVGSLLLPNPVAEGVGLLGKVGGAAASRAAPQAMAKVFQVAKRVPSPVASLAGYEATAPLAAGLSADAEGHRMEAAGAAASDPMGTTLSVVGGGLGSLGKNAILNSPGGRARQLIEEHGNGARVGLLTPGKGGVFDRELAGLPANGRGIGIARKRGSNAILDNLEQAHADTHGLGYREGPKMMEQAARDVRDTNRSAGQDVRQAGKESVAEIQRAERDARETAAERAPALLGDIDERHRVEGSEPYRVLSEQIDQKAAAMPPRDAAPIVTQLDNALHDLEVPGDVQNQLGAIRSRLEHFRDPATGAILVPERQLNGLRRNLMDLAKVGTTDAPRGHDAPLRQAAYVAKQMVDEGPYAALNQLYAESAAARGASREALGLKARPGSDRATEEKGLKGALVRSVADPTALPAEAPPEADMGQFRQRIEDARANRSTVANMAEERQRRALADQAAVRDRVEAGAAAAVPDRRLLGLNERIGARKTDATQVGLALMRDFENTPTAGGNPSELDAFRQAHPELALQTRLPALQNAKADLSYSPVPTHGTLAQQVAGGAAGPVGSAVMMATGQGLGHAAMTMAMHQALVNHKLLAGRVLYRPAQKLNPVAIAEGLGVARGAATADTLGDKVKAAIEAKKMEQSP
jgi:hypothetical protein